jgi:CDGSH-type Zn-finger protein
MQFCNINFLINNHHPKKTEKMEPKIAQKAPCAIDVEAGKNYYWCSCGQSNNQPFCDGSHKGTEFAPMKVSPAESGKVYFCGCKHSNNKPFCDGAHAKL